MNLNATLPIVKAGALFLTLAFSGCASESTRETWTDRYENAVEHHMIVEDNAKQAALKKERADLFRQADAISTDLDHEANPAKAKALAAKGFILLDKINRVQSQIEL